METALCIQPNCILVESLIRRFVYDIDSWNESYCDHAVTNILKDKKQYFTTVCRLGIQPFQKGAYLCAA